MLGIFNVFKRKKEELTETSQKVTTASTTEIDQFVVKDISVDMLMKTKLDFSHRLEHSFKTFLSGIRSSITDIGYRIKSVVMPGRKDTSGEMERLEAVYKNSDARFSYIKTDPDGLDLEPLEVDDSAEAAKQAQSENEFSLMDRLKGLFSKSKKEPAEQPQSENELSLIGRLKGLFSKSKVEDKLVQENASNAEAENGEALAEQAESENKLSLIGRLKGLFSKSKVEDKLVQENASNAEAFCENGEALAEQAKSESKLSLMDRLKGWFSKSKKESDTINESVEDKLVYGETDSAEPNENKFEEGASFTGELDIKEEDTLSIAKPELSEREKSGFVKRCKTFVTNLFSTRATESSGFVETHHDASSVNSLDLSSGQTPAASTPPPSYAVATQGQPDDTNWRERCSPKGTSGSFEERLKERTAVDKKGVICTDL